jgi:hypothetical protein
MEGMKVLEVRPFSSVREYERMVDYFLGAEDSFLNGMGVARSLLPPREKWLRSALADHQAPGNRGPRVPSV